MADYIDAERAAPALQPCPFCGSYNVKAFYYGQNIGGEPDAFAQCQDCTTTGPNGKDEAEAIAAWNRRTPASIGEDGLPELPDAAHRGPNGTGSYFDSYTADQMRQYARDAVEADRRAREEAGNALNDLLPREVTVTNYGNPVDKFAPEVKIERGRVWIVKGNQSFMLAYEPDADEPEATEWYANQLRGVLSSFTPCVNSAAQGEESLQAAQGVKTWQERESAYETEPMRQIDQMDAEIAELRAQMARLSHGEPLAWRFKRRGDRFWQTTADREVAASIGGANVEIVPLYAAPPLSSEQQAARNPPLDPTPEMIRAGREALRACGNDMATARDAELCWSAMIEAMPNREAA